MTVLQHGRVEVVEPPLAHRVRRPSDLLRAATVLVVLAITVIVGTIAHGTATGVETDVAGAVELVPRPALYTLNLITGFGFLALPIAVSVDLFVRHRGRQLLDATAGTLFAALGVLALDSCITHFDNLRQLRFALSVGVDGGGLSRPLHILLATETTFLVVARVGDRRGMLPLSFLVVSASLATSLLAGATTLLSLGASLLLGILIGLTTRVILGTVPSRPDGVAIAETLSSSLPDLVRLERAVVRHRDGRQYFGTLADNRRIDVIVLDRDFEGAGLPYRLWRLLLVRGPVAGRTLVSVQRTVERDALMTYALTASGIHTPKLLAVSEVGPSAVLLAYESIHARPMSELAPEDINDQVLDATWEQLAALRRANLAHRSLTADNLLVTPTRSVLLTGVRGGELAATDLHLRLDAAQLVTTLSLATDPRRAVSSAARVLGPDTLLSVLPVLQPLVLARTTRQALRKRRGLIDEVRSAVIARAPGEPDVPEPDSRLERLTIRKLMLVVGGAVAAYLVLSQLSHVDLADILHRAKWQWAGVALACSAATYVGAAFSLKGFVLEYVPFVRALLAQVASSFVNLIAPPAVGGPTLNARFLQRQGLDAPVAVATIGVWQAAAFIVHVVLLVVAGVLAGTQAHTSFDPPVRAVVGAAVVLLLACFAMTLPWLRHWVVGRASTLGREVLPRLLAVAQRPGKLAEGVAGSVFLNVAYCSALVASVHAFGGNLPWEAISLVYLAGSAVGAAAPTPGGLGAVETALAAGLTAAGLDGVTAVSSVLLFRLATYWVPVAPGWLAFHYLQRHGAL